MYDPHDAADKDAVNEDYEPTERQQEVLDVFRRLYVTNPATIVKNTEMSKQGVQDTLDRLLGAGWVERVSHGQYRLRYDGIGYVVLTAHYEHEADHIGVPTLSERTHLDEPTIEAIEEPEPIEWMADVPSADAASPESDEADVEGVEDEVDLSGPTPVEEKLDRLLREAGLGEKNEGER